MPYLIDRLTFPRRRDVAAHCGAILRRGAITSATRSTSSARS